MSMLSEALEYVHRGWYVLPCREKPGTPYDRDGEEITPMEKEPYVAKGVHAASNDEDQVKAWWSKWPDALIGVNAGLSGLFVVDIDKKHVNGFDTFAQWNINDTTALHSITPSGGMHIIFSGSGKTTSNAKTGIDTRGESGYFIAPPSKIQEGEYTGEYTRFDDWSRRPGVIPDGLMGKLFPENTTQYVRGSISSDGTMKQLSRKTLTFLVEGALPGERNTSLFNALTDFVGCGYSKEQARETVYPSAKRIGLSDSEFNKVLEHAYSKPRTSSIPDEVQEKILENKKTAASKLDHEEEIALENTLIACMIKENDIIPSIDEILNFSDFQSLSNRVIYKAIISLHNTGISVDYVTVSSAVGKESGKINIEAINSISFDTLNTENAISYAYIVREKASLRKLEGIMDNKEKYLKGTLSEVIGKIEKDIANVALYGGARSTNVIDSKQATASLTEQTRKVLNGEISQLKIGFPDYDNYIGGLFPGELVLCAGRPGDGKSALSLSIANNIAIKQGKSVGYFSLEMSTNETICRLISQITGIPFRKVWRGELSEDQWKEYKNAVDMINSSNMYFDDSSSPDVREIRSKVRKLAEKGLDMVVIDQLEQIYTPQNISQISVKYDTITYAIKAMAKEFDLPIILNHQLNRASTSRQLKESDKEPNLSDLNQAGEKAPNQVWVIYHRRDEDREIIQSKIMVLKNRGGPIMDLNVSFIGNRFLFASKANKNDIQQADNYRKMEDNDDDIFIEDEDGETQTPPWS